MITAKAGSSEAKIWESPRGTEAEITLEAQAHGGIVLTRATMRADFMLALDDVERVRVVAEFLESMAIEAAALAMVLRARASQMAKGE